MFWNDEYTFLSGNIWFASGVFENTNNKRILGSHIHTENKFKCLTFVQHLGPIDMATKLSFNWNNRLKGKLEKSPLRLIFFFLQYHTHSFSHISTTLKLFWHNHSLFYLVAWQRAPMCTSACLSAPVFLSLLMCLRWGTIWSRCSGYPFPCQSRVWLWQPSVGKTSVQASAVDHHDNVLGILRQHGEGYRKNVGTGAAPQYAMKRKFIKKKV